MRDIYSNVADLCGFVEESTERRPLVKKATIIARKRAQDLYLEEVELEDDIELEDDEELDVELDESSEDEDDEELDIDEADIVAALQEVGIGGQDIVEVADEELDEELDEIEDESSEDKDDEEII